MDTKTLIISFLPSILFFIAFLFLVYSSLLTPKILTLQNDVVVIFIKSLKEADLSESLIKTLSFLWSNMIFSSTIFLALISIGFIINILFLVNTDFKILLASNILVVILTLIISKFSIVFLLTGIGLILGTLWIQKTFERKKNEFLTGHSFIKSQLKTIAIFLTIGIFLFSMMNTQSHEQQIYESNMEIIKEFIPQTSELKELQKEQIREITEGIKQSINEQYQTIPEQTKTQCGAVYGGIIQGLDNYETQASEQIDRQELGIDQEQIPFFDIIIKTTPIFTAIGFYIILNILNFFMSILAGIVYAIIKR